MTDAKRAEQQGKKAKAFGDRPGPERAKGEKAGEYRERIKRHDYVMERQIVLAEFHRDRHKKRLDKRKP